MKKISGLTVWSMLAIYAYALDGTYEISQQYQGRYLDTVCMYDDGSSSAVQAKVCTLGSNDDKQKWRITTAGMIQNIGTKRYIGDDTKMSSYSVNYSINGSGEKYQIVKNNSYLSLYKNIDGYTYAVGQSSFPQFSLVNWKISSTNITSTSEFIQSKTNTNFALDIYGGETKAGSKLVMWSKHGASNQKWKYNSATGEIKSDLNGLCLDVSGGSVYNGANVTMWSCHGGANQKWKYNSATGEIKSNLSDSMCLDVLGGSIYNGAGVAMWNCHGGVNQKFEFSSK